MPPLPPRDLEKLRTELRGLPREDRHFPATVELRGTEQAPELSGESIVFNQLSEIIGGWFPFREEIAPGAFTKSIASRAVLAFWSHITSMPLGRTDERTLIVSETPTGVHSRIFPGDESWSVDAVKAVRRRSVKHQSFGMRVLTDEWRVVDGMDVRTVLEGELYEVSPVALPAYPQTSLDARSIGGVDLREIFAAYRSCRAGNALPAEIELVRRLARELDAASGPPPDVLRLKHKLELEQLELLSIS